MAETPRAARTEAAGEVILPDDDVVIAFRLERSGIRGRLIRIGPALDAILSRHGAPEAVHAVLAEALLLAGVLGSALPDGGGLSLQTRTDGPISFLIADCLAPGRLRGYARFDAERLTRDEATAGSAAGAAVLLGNGLLAITIDPGSEGERYQSVLTLDGRALKAAATAYFEQRESLPTFLELAVARQFVGAGASAKWHWRGGGLLMQDVAGRADGSEADGDADDGWSRALMLAATIEAHELLDPTLATRRLLLRLFHEDGVIIDRVIRLQASCRCSREKVLNVLQSFGADELADMVDKAGNISVTCEFCAARYDFAVSDIAVP